MSIEQTFTIDRPPSEVFDLLSDAQRLPEWQKGTAEVRRDRSGPLVEGEVFGEVHVAFGRRLESTVEVVEHDPPRRFALRIVDGPLPFDGGWTLTADGGATRVAFAGELRRGGRLMRAIVARQFRGHHRRLRRLAEAQRVSSPASITNSVPVR